MVYNKAAYKQFFKVFYKKINKKKYKSQILKHNIRYTKIVAIQDVIPKVKILFENIKKKILL